MDNMYSPEWFQERALNSLKRIDEKTWDYSDSLLLYPPGGESVYEDAQDEGGPYADLITKLEHSYLHTIAHDVVAELPNEFDFIDLGPGTAHKEQYIFDAAKKAGKKFTYYPVDISEYYLQLAKRHAEDQNIDVETIQSSFEELPDGLKTSTVPRFVSLGLTFTNYHPHDILSLLTKIAGKNSFIFVNAQMRDRTDMDSIVSVYAEVVRGMVEGKALLLGLDPKKDIEKIYADDGVRAWCTIKNTNQTLEQKGVRAGDTLLVLQSLRYTKEGFESELTKTGLAYSLLDVDNPFVGALIYT